MRPKLQKFLRALSLAAAPLLLALATSPWIDELLSAQRSWLERAPWLLVACAGLLALRFHRPGLALSLLVSLAVLPHWGLPQSLLAVLVPFNLFLLTLWAQAELTWVLALALQATTLHWLSGPLQDGILRRWEVLVVEPLPMVLALLALGSLLWTAVRTGGALEASQLVVAAGALLALQSPPSPELLVAASALSVLLALVQHSYRLAYLDELTELPGRRALQEELSRLRGTYAIAMLDVDHFKSFNDRYGHDVGDQVLRLVASRMRRASGGARAFRYGGEEFTMVFPGRTLDEAWEPLEDLRQMIEGTPMVLRGADRPKKKPRNLKPRRGSGQKVSVTISIGVAQRNDKLPTPERVVKAADKALYKAKRNGRNQVAC